MHKFTWLIILINLALTVKGFLRPSDPYRLDHFRDDFLSSQFMMVVVVTAAAIWTLLGTVCDIYFDNSGVPRTPIIKANAVTGFLFLALIFFSFWLNYHISWFIGGDFPLLIALALCTLGALCLKREMYDFQALSFSHPWMVAFAPCALFAAVGIAAFIFLMMSGRGMSN